MAVLTRQKVHFGPVELDSPSAKLGRELSLRSQPFEVLTVLLERPLLKTLATLCFAIAIMASVSDRVIAATQTAPAQVSTAGCPHPLDKDGNPLWKPTHADLHLMIARNFGFVAKKYPAKSGPGLNLQSHDSYLDSVPGWQIEALNNPEQANFCNADLRGAELRGAALFEAILSNTDLSSADLRGAYLGGSDLRGAHLSKANLNKAHADHAILTDADLRGADLTGANLQGADLRDAALNGADLSGTDLSGADLRDAQLKRSKLRHAQLSRANLSFADIGFADLSGADLTDAKVRNAKLTSAMLSDSNLSGADLWGADLYRADVSGAVGVTNRVITDIRTPPAQASAATCPHPLDEFGHQTWEPTDGELNRILARHRGWLQHESRYLMKLEAPDAYLDNDLNPYGDRVKPAFPGWRREAQKNPEKANLCNADLNVAILSGAILIGADLKNSDLVSASLRGAHLGDADLRGADLENTDLRDTYLGIDFSDPMKAMPIGILLRFPGADLRNANLGEADLSGVDLRRSKLNGADLRGAKLACVNKSNDKPKCARLDDVDLTGAKLQAYSVWPGKSGHGDILVTDLSGASLYRAKLSTANLSGADLQNAKLIGADLSGVRLTCVDEGDLGRKCTNLRGTDLTGANVSKAKLDHVDLTGATYATISEPPDPYVAGIVGLTTLNAAKGEQIGLIQLRKLFQDTGLRDSEREVTFSIERNVTSDELSSRFLRFVWIEGVLQRIGFGWSTAYGLYPERALVGILLLGIILTPAYMMFVLHPTQESRIITVFPEDRVDTIAGDSINEQERKKVVEATNWRRALGWASYFSLLSAVNIGFEQFTPGDWIRRLQGREYSLQAIGWVRTMAGTQALISVYLLAMWVITRFGRPFE